jgi:hypothetical protein
MQQYLTSTWAMKKKANGTFRARLNARGFEQIDGEHFDADDKAAPVVSEITIRIIFVILIMAIWTAELMDVRGAFLHGDFDPKHHMYMYVPQGFEAFYPSNVVLLLLHTLYGTVQAAMQFWKKFLEALRRMNFQRSKADACLYFKWTSNGLVIFISWVDDLLCCGNVESVKEEAKEKHYSKNLIAMKWNL